MVRWSVGGDPRTPLLLTHEVSAGGQVVSRGRPRVPLLLMQKVPAGGQVVSRGRPPSPPVAHAGSLFRRSAFLGCRFFRCQWWLRCCSLNLLRMLSHTAIGVGVREQGVWDAVSALECHQSSLLWVSSCGLAVTLSQSLRMVLSSDYARSTPAVFSAHRPVASPRTSQAEAQAPQKLNFEKSILNVLN